MTLGQVIHLLRWAAAVALLLGGGVIALFAAILLSDGIPRTEGSPAGTIIAAILMSALLAAPILLMAGAAMAFRLSRLPWPRPQARAVALTVSTAPRGEFWCQHPNGAQLGALFNGGRAVLLWDPGSGSAAACSQGPRAAEGAPTHPFVDAQHRLLQLPYSLTLPELLAQREQEQFTRTGQRSDALDWIPLDSALERREDAWELVASARPRSSA